MPPTRPDYYEIAVRQFQQQVLPPGLPPTTVWSYGSANHPGTFNFPAFTIEAAYGRPTTVKWMNQLVDADRDYLPHLLPVDPTLHWANPPGGRAGRDTRPHFLATPSAYRARNGANDRGDISGLRIHGQRLVAEVKNCARQDLPGWIREAPVDLLTLPRTGIPVPSTAECAAEGFMPPPTG